MQIAALKAHSGRELGGLVPRAGSIASPRTLSETIVVTILFATSSLPRHFRPAFLSAKKFIFDRLESKPYVAAHFAEVDESDRTEIKSSYGRVSADCRIVFEKDPELTQDLLLMNANVDGAAVASGMRGNLYQWLSMKRCLDLILELEKDVGRFDWIIWARPDLFYFSELEMLSRLPADALYFPIHDNWGGLNDRFCVGSADLVKQRMGIFDYFVEKWYPRFHARDLWNPEKVLRDFISDELGIKIRRTRVAFGKLRTDHVTRPYWDLTLKCQRSNIESWLTMPVKTGIKLSLMPSRAYPKEGLKGFPLDFIQKYF